jgi:hypothetical protein
VTSLTSPPSKVTRPSKALPGKITPWQGKALVRIKHPNKRLYYRSAGGEPWVESGYDTWRINDWLKIYGRGYGDDGRNWEFFGEEIELWPDNEGEETL